MQNKYVGDIGDYGKYGLLRDLFSSDHKLGIIWYLVPDERHVNDGRYIDYLSKNRFQDCDSELFLILKNIVSLNRRNITAIERSKMFSDRTNFYSEILTYNNIQGNTPAGRQKRLELREQWLRGALETATNCDAIFLDPDNGLETPSVQKHFRKAPKYVYYNEVERFLSSTKTLIVYHHFNRKRTHHSQIEQRKKTLQDISKSHEILSLRFWPYSPRVYFILTRQSDVIDRVNIFANSEWRQCFELHT